MAEIKKVKIQNLIESQIPEFLNEDNPLFKEFLEQYYISLEHQTGSVDLATSFIDYKKIDYFNNETFYNNITSCILEEDLVEFATNITVNTTIGFPSKYGLLKINNEIITYTSKTNTTFEGCIRGFSGIDSIENGTFNFTQSNTEFHTRNSIVNNLNLNFFAEIFKKFRYQFLPGFENRNLIDNINLQTILTRAKDYYTSKGTDTSYKILFKILFNEDIEIIKPQEYLLRPSANTNFITKNILVEKILGDLEPLEIRERKETIAESITLYQQTPNGLASASIYNIEIRPINGKFLYEISLDPDSFTIEFVSTKKTNVLENSNANQNYITVDSTVGFPPSGTLLVQSKNAPSSFEITYSDKTINQFLGVSNNSVRLSKGDTLIENNFAYVFLSGQSAYFRIINVIDNVDFTNTSGLKVNDVINLSSFGLELNQKPEFNSWIYNIPTSHRIKSITKLQSSWRIELLDKVKFFTNELLSISDPDSTDLTDISGTVSRIINDNIIEIICGDDISTKTVVSKLIEKSNVFNYPDSNILVSNIQNSYIDKEEKNFFITSSGLPSYRVTSNNRKVLISTPQNPGPFSGIGNTTILNTNIKHRFYTGEKIYLTPSETLGISTGVYFITALGSNNDSQQISLSYSDSDLFSKKHVLVSYGSTGDFVKLNYENRSIEHQKLLRKFPLPYQEYKKTESGDKTTNNKPIGTLVNGVEIYSPTLYDENIYYGKLNNIQILKHGDNYDVINSPELEITDTIEGITYGRGASAHLNIIGSVKGVKIVNPGSGYTKDVKISISGGNGYGAALEANVIKTRISSGFRGDGTGVNPTDNSIRFVFPHNFEDGEIIEYFSNNNREIEYSDSVTGEIRKLPTNSFYFAGVISDTIIKLYRTKEDAANKRNEINLTTSPSFGFHYFRSLGSKFSLVDVNVKDSGVGYSNKNVIIPSIDDNVKYRNGINIVDNYITAENHNFKNKDLVVYTTNGTEIAGLSTNTKYFVKVLDDNSFQLTLAEVDGKIVEENYNNEKYVRLNSYGSGTHKFSYPPIKLTVEASLESSNGKLILPTLEPIILGPIDSVFLENPGEKYGVSNIVNFHRKPNVNIKSPTSTALFKPVVIDGTIVEVQVLNYGNNYGKDIDLVVTGNGKLADLYPVVENGKIVSVIVLNGGIGYDNDTSIRVQRRGVGARFQGNIFEWKINQVIKNKFFLENEDEGIIVPSKNMQTGLQFIHFYPPKVLRKKLNDNIDFENREESNPKLSPIIGWSYDGFPIYGPYLNIDNIISKVRSSYRQLVERNVNLRPTGIDFPDGFFIQDYIFDKEYGDLDEYNGRYIKNIDFPNGTYAYFFTIDLDNDRTSTPQYPYIISKEFKRNPELENYDPRFNQDLDFNKLNLIRNVSPYYLNSTTSYYDLIDNVEEKYKQEFIVKSISKSGVDSLSVYISGDNYKVGDILDFRSDGTGGSGATATVSSLQGKEISAFNVGVTTIYPVSFAKRGREVTAIAQYPINLLDGESVNISDISSSSHKFLEGTKQIVIFDKSVGLTTNIRSLNVTGNITTVYPNDISGFEVGDYIKIDEETLKIIQILPEVSGFRVERLSNSGIHTAGLSNINLLPRKFKFYEKIHNLTLLENITTYFNPVEVIATGNSPKSYTISGISTISIPERSIYIPNHSYNTGQPLVYNSGISGIGLSVYNYPGDSSFQLQDNQILYAVNLGKDFVGISTLGFTTTTGIGSTNNSLYFDSNVSGVGLAHSFTTTYSQVLGKVENYSVIVNTEENHNLINQDIINLNLVPEITETVKFRYDPVIRKITTKTIDFNSLNVSLEKSEILIGEVFNTGDKVVYYDNGNTTLGGLENNKSYFIIKDNPGKIRLAEYYSDSISGVGISITSVGSGVHSIAKINPPITITKGNYVVFDLSDSSLSGLSLRLYRDINFNDEIESYNYISNFGEKFIRTNLNVYPREIYYSFCSVSMQVCPDNEVKNMNLIVISDSEYKTDFNITKINETRFKFNLKQKPENLTYTTNNVSELKYTTKSKSTTGPIDKLYLNYGGKGYSTTPVITNIISQNGSNAIVKAKSKKIGRISSIERVKDGFDYPTDNTLLPLLSTPAIIQVEGISRVDYVGIITGGKNYNYAPRLKVIGNDNIKLEAIVQGRSVVDVKILENTNDLFEPLQIISTRNTNGYGIDDITVNGSDVTIELLNSNNQIYPLITVGFGKSEVVFPFSVGDEIFIERCRISENTQERVDNYNSSNYNYKFFTITGISTENYTLTYSMDGVKSNLNLGEYTSDFGYGYVVNRKDIAEFEMFIKNDLKYNSNETVLGYNNKGVNTFTAKVMENGWNNNINELRLIDVKGDLNIGDRLYGQSSLLNGIVTDINIFNLKTNVGVFRDKINDLGDRVGFLNDSQQKISDNNYYQKFSYSIRGKVPYNVWKEPVKSLIHPSGFKEFSDLVIKSQSSATMKVGTASSLDFIVNIDNVKSLYTRSNFAMVTEDDQFEDGSIERVLFEEGIALRPYLLSKTNKVIQIDDISSQFDGTSTFEIIANRPVTFISTELYRLGVSTQGLSVGDKVGYSTYHYYPDSTYILNIGNGFVGLSTFTPHRLYSIGGVSTSVTQSLDFSRRVLGAKNIGTREFKLTNNGNPLFYKEFDASNGITTSINLETNTFIVPNHNFQTGQKIVYESQTPEIIAVATTSIGSGAILFPIFDKNDFSVSEIRVISGGVGYDHINKPNIKILGTENPLISGSFIPLIESITGIITGVQVNNPGLGYYPSSVGKIGITTTNESEGRKDTIISVGGGIGSAIYERGYNVAITTTISGISSGVQPNFSGQQNVFWAFNDPYIPVKSTSGTGVGAKFSVFIVYNPSTGQPISTSLILRDGGRRYSVGDTVSIAGTYIGGATPNNDLSFKISKVSSTRILLDANKTYSNVPANTVVGFGSNAIFNISRDNTGDIKNVEVVYGGYNYNLTDNISIAGTYIGGNTPLDNLLLSPTLLGTDKLPTTLYVEKLTNNTFKVSGTSTGNILDLTSLGIGTHSFTLADPNSSSIITIDNIIQIPVHKKTIDLGLEKPVKYTDATIYLTGNTKSLVLNDYIKINEEYMQIKNISVGGENAILVERSSLGTKKAVHNLGDLVNIVYGNYNIIKDTIYFASAPFGLTGFPGLEVGSSFYGRAFSRRFDPFTPEDKNIIFDDISDQFTGIAATEFVLKTDGVKVSGIFTNTNSFAGGSASVDINNNPIILINNIPQIGGVDYNIDTPGENTIRFISGVPIAGKITNVGYNTGLGYLPLVGASATVAVSAAGTISNVYLTGFGKGYKEPPIISIASTVGFGASIAATIGIAGTVTSLTIINPGVGYTSRVLPEVRINAPQNYYNLNLEYASGYTGMGTGAKCSVIVGNGSSIISFELNNLGIGYSVGDVLVVPGISTNPYASSFEEFRVNVLETFTDRFSGWYPGQFIQFDDIAPFFNGVKKKFTLTVTNFGQKQILSLKANPEDVIITNNLFVFVNDVLQVPGESYSFTGTRLIFTEAPKFGSKCDVIFFRGSDLDVEQIDPPRTIKEGDFIQIDENIFDPFDRPQFERVVKDIITTDLLDTFTYDSLGISTDQTKLRPLNWTKQTEDRVINGALYSKSRPSLKSRVIPTAKVIKDISKTDSKIYVDSAIPLFEDIDENRTLNEDMRDIIIINNREIADPVVKASISYGSTISSIEILNSGSGYENITNPLVIISPRFITRTDPIYNWDSNTGVAISTEFDFKSVGYGTAYLAVGLNGKYAISYNGTDWYNSENSINQNYNFNSVIGYENSYIAIGQSGFVYKTVGISTTSSWEKIDLLRVTQDILGRLEITPSNYSGTFNAGIYDENKNTLVIVGDNGGIFDGVGLNTSGVYQRSISFSTLNSIAASPTYFVAVGNSGDILYSVNGSNWEINSIKPTLQNLNDIIWDGTKFIVVGNNGTILQSNDGLMWNIISVNNFNKNIVKINYSNNLYTILDSTGKLYFSINLIDWVYRNVNNNYILRDIISVDINEKYISVGSSGFISYATPTLNTATAISTVFNGKLEKIDVINGGFGYSNNLPNPVLVESETTEKEQIYSIKAKGDYGIITNILVYESGNIGFGTTSPAIEFTLKSDNFVSTFPNMQYTEINTGDYFIISNSNVICGHALTGITTSLGGMSNYPKSIVGTTTSFIDGIYRVEYSSPNILGITTVRCLFTPIPAVGADEIQVNIGVNTTGFYGRYSFGIIYDYQNRARETPKSFTVNKNNGLVGLVSGPSIYRTRGLI